MSLQGRTLFITGASRGIGKAIGLRAAADGANIVIVSKTDTPHPKLPGTIHTAAAEMVAAGGQAIAVATDIRDPDAIAFAVSRAAEAFGGIDIVVNNASAIFLAGTVETTMKRFDLMFGVNVRGTYATSQAAMPYLLRSNHAHILNISPPLSMEAKWFAPNTAYTMSKYGMSMCALGMAAEFKGRVGVNTLWPRTTIATSAVEMLGGPSLMAASRTTDIVADAAWHILTQDPRTFTGQHFIDEDLLRTTGVTDFSKYNATPGVEPTLDWFV